MNGILDSMDENVAIYKDSSVDTELGAWWDVTDIRTNNIQIDTLFIVDKVVDYDNASDDSKEICDAKAIDSDMP